MIADQGLKLCWPNMKKEVHASIFSRHELLNCNQLIDALLVTHETSVICPETFLAHGTETQSAQQSDMQHMVLDILLVILTTSNNACLC